MLPLNNQPFHTVPTTLPSPTESPQASPTEQSTHRADFSGHPLHQDMQRDMLGFLQNMKPPPSLSKMRDQVPDAVWKNKDGVATRELVELLNTPIGKEMSRALQTKFGGSTYDALTWGMAGLASMMTNQIEGTDNYYIDGFDWGGKDNNPGNMLKHLKEFLVLSELETPELAGTVAYVRLWKSAPEYLLQNLPASVDIDGKEWEDVEKEVLKLNLKHPLTTLGMTYDQILDRITPSRVAEREKLVI